MTKLARITMPGIGNNNWRNLYVTQDRKFAIVPLTQDAPLESVRTELIVDSVVNDHRYRVDLLTLELNHIIEETNLQSFINITGGSPCENQ